MLNTRYYEGFVDSPAKLIKIQDGEMSELGDAPAPVKQIYNDARTYEFEGFAVRMSSPFMMECIASQDGSNLSSAAAVCKASKSDPRNETSEAKDKISNGGKQTRKRQNALAAEARRVSIYAGLPARRSDVAF